VCIVRCYSYRHKIMWCTNNALGILLTARTQDTTPSFLAPARGRDDEPRAGTELGARTEEARSGEDIACIHTSMTVSLLFVLWQWMPSAISTQPSVPLYSPIYSINVFETWNRILNILAAQWSSISYFTLGITWLLDTDSTYIRPHARWIYGNYPTRLMMVLRSIGGASISTLINIYGCMFDAFCTSFTTNRAIYSFNFSWLDKWLLDS